MQITVEKIKSMKGKEKISVLTSYDYPTSKIMDGIIDVILVGDSLGMVVLGYENTLDVNMDDMVRFTAAVNRATDTSLVVSDLPAGSYDTSEDALRNAQKLIDAGAKCVKIENQNEIAKALVKAGFEVMGHVGLTPQTVTDFKVQGKDKETAQKILKEAKALEKAGCFSVVLECIPSSLSKKITKSLRIPTIGIGAGSSCDGQVLVIHDMLGLFDKFSPKFVKKYADLSEEMRNAFKKYNSEVKKKKFPSEKHSFS